MQRPPKIQWLWKILIRDLGGPAKLRDRIAERGIVPPEYETIKGWATRNSVPGRWAPLVIMIGEEEKNPLTGEAILPKVSNLWGGVR